MPTGNVAICSRCRKGELTKDSDPRFIDANSKERQMPRGWSIIEHTTVDGCKAGELCEDCGQKYDELVAEFIKEVGAPELELEGRLLPEADGRRMEGVPALTMEQRRLLPTARAKALKSKKEE